MESTRMETIFTVPAVWSDKAKSDTLECVHQAGFGERDQIRVITEPEAAAVYTFHQVCCPPSLVAIMLMSMSCPISPSRSATFS